MPRFLPYQPDQAYLLPPSVKDVLAEDHLCFFLHRVVECLDLSQFRAMYGEEGGAAYEPALMLKVWLYAYALGLTSSRRLEERIREDLAFRYLAGGATPDYWALNQFRKRHGRGLNDVFTQVVELARGLGLGQLGRVAIDSTRIAANASRDRMDKEQTLRAERARIRRQIRRWQQQCATADGQEAAGTRIGAEKMSRLEQRLEQIPVRLQRLRKSGQKQLSRTDPDSRFLRERGRFVLGYTAEVAVGEGHLIVAERVTQNASDNRSLVPMVEQVEQQCGQRPKAVLADTGFFSAENLRQMKERGVEAYVPDPNLAYELHGRGRASGIGRYGLRDESVRHMRERLRTAAGRAVYQQRKVLVEPVLGVLKEQRGMRRFRRRGLAAVAVEFTLACIAYNLTRLYHRS